MFGVEVEWATTDTPAPSTGHPRCDLSCPAHADSPASATHTQPQPKMPRGQPSSSSSGLETNGQREPASPRTGAGLGKGPVQAGGAGSSALAADTVPSIEKRYREE